MVAASAHGLASDRGSGLASDRDEAGVAGEFRGVREAAAVADFSKAIKQNPNYSFAFNNRGWSRFKLGDTNGAIKDIDLARSKKPDNPYIYRNLGIIALEKKDVRGACTHFQHALELGFTALHGDEVERLVKEHCPNALPRSGVRENAPSGTSTDPGTRSRTRSRSNAPE